MTGWGMKLAGCKSVVRSISLAFLVLYLVVELFDPVIEDGEIDPPPGLTDGRSRHTAGDDRKAISASF